MDAWSVLKTPNPCACEDYASISLFLHKLERWRLAVGRGGYKENATVKPSHEFDTYSINCRNKCSHACRSKTKCNYFIKNYIRHGHHNYRVRILLQYRKPVAAEM